MRDIRVPAIFAARRRKMSHELAAALPAPQIDSAHRASHLQPIATIGPGGANGRQKSM